MADNFCWVEGYSKAVNIVKSLATALTTSKDDCNWILEYPETLESITNIAILKTITSFGLEAYTKFEIPEGVFNYVTVTIGKSIITGEDNIKDIETEQSSEPANFAWYKTDSTIELFEWIPVQYWISFNKDFANIVLQGDPSIDAEPYSNYLISYAYIGAVESFENSEIDTEGNFGLTVSSDVLPEVSKKYGEKTANCITDIGMFETRMGALFQSHLIKFSTGWEYSDKLFIGASQWTNKHHMSEIILTHSYDRERGKLQNVLIGNREAINHLDILAEDVQVSEETKTNKYVMFNINAPFSILNNTPNVLYGVALRKE